MWEVNAHTNERAWGIYERRVFLFFFSFRDFLFSLNCLSSILLFLSLVLFPIIFLSLYGMNTVTIILHLGFLLLSVSIMDWIGPRWKRL